MDRRSALWNGIDANDSTRADRPSEPPVPAAVTGNRSEPSLGATESSPAIALRGVCKEYGREVRALDDVNLSVHAGEFVTLLGPSGSGKTTLLMILAGFESPSRGQVFAGAQDITNLPPQRRNFGIVFQSYALFPHMSVQSNVAYPLAARGIRGGRRAELVRDALALVGLEGLGHRRPSQLSGGQQQRVALARALVYRPRVLLLDEPLGALDRAMRERMQAELKRLHRKVGVTFVYVTHDQDEALRMSDRVVVISEGRIEQVGSPEDVYLRPATRFVAGFVGSTNLLPGQAVTCSGSSARIKLDDGVITEVGSAANVVSGGGVFVVVRPDKIAVSLPGAPYRGGELNVVGRLEQETFGGTVWLYEIATSIGVWHVALAKRLEAQVGDAVDVRWRPNEAWAVPVPS
jgi:putative spermidine/putrescine transport system ATP-binding protein